MKRLRMIKNVLINRRNASDSRYQNLGAVLLFIFLLPYIASFFFGITDPAETSEDMQEAVAQENAIVDIQFEWNDFIVCNKSRAGTEKMPMEAYIASRLASTIPSDYEMEAVKAQAVVLRTELLRIYFESAPQEGEPYRYIYVESETPQPNDEKYQIYKEAAQATEGMYLSYENKPIYAPYFFVSAGKTRNGAEVLTDGDYPYLKAVSCGRDFTSEQYAAGIKMDQTVFEQKIKELFPVLPEETDFSLEKLKILRDESDYVVSISLEGSKVSGESFRTAFLLNSSCFTLEKSGENVQIRTKGVGHGLGFGQYSANELAKKDSDYIEILNNFFTDIVIEKIE